MQAELEAEQQSVAFTPIECDYLDGENVGWTKKYLENCRKQLEAAETDDPTYAQYLKAEIAAYEELLERFAKPKA